MVVDVVWLRRVSSIRRAARVLRGSDRVDPSRGEEPPRAKPMNVLPSTLAAVRNERDVLRLRRGQTYRPARRSLETRAKRRPAWEGKYRAPQAPEGCGRAIALARSSGSSRSSSGKADCRFDAAASRAWSVVDALNIGALRCGAPSRDIEAVTVGELRPVVWRSSSAATSSASSPALRPPFLRASPALPSRFFPRASSLAQKRRSCAGAPAHVLAARASRGTAHCSRY